MFNLKGLGRFALFGLPPEQLGLSEYEVGVDGAADQFALGHTG